MKEWEELERIWLEEKGSTTLSPLPPDFYSKISRYLSRLRAELERREGVERELVEEEMREAVGLLEELFALRAQKALKAILRGESPPSQGEGEARLFSRLREVLEEARREMLGGEPEEAPRPQHELLVVLGKVPRIVGEDLRYYGPFEEGEIVSLPSSTAELLVAHRLARKLHPKRFFGGGRREVDENS